MFGLRWARIHEHLTGNDRVMRYCLYTMYLGAAILILYALHIVIFRRAPGERELAIVLVACSYLAGGGSLYLSGYVRGPEEKRRGQPAELDDLVTGEYKIVFIHSYFWGCYVGLKDSQYGHFRLLRLRKEEISEVHETTPKWTEETLVVSIDRRLVRLFLYLEAMRGTLVFSNFAGKRVFLGRTPVTV